jgi:hypothetical protein
MAWVEPELVTGAERLARARARAVRTQGGPAGVCVGPKSAPVLPWGFRNVKGLDRSTSQALDFLVEPTGIEPVTSTMPL